MAAELKSGQASLEQQQATLENQQASLNQQAAELQRQQARSKPSRRRWRPRRPSSDAEAQPARGRSSGRSGRRPSARRCGWSAIEAEIRRVRAADRDTHRSGPAGPPAARLARLQAAATATIAELKRERGGGRRSSGARPSALAAQAGVARRPEAAARGPGERSSRPRPTQLQAAGRRAPEAGRLRCRPRPPHCSSRRPISTRSRPRRPSSRSRRTQLQNQLVQDADQGRRRRPRHRPAAGEAAGRADQHQGRRAGGSAADLKARQRRGVHRDRDHGALGGGDRRPRAPSARHGDPRQHAARASPPSSAGSTAGNVDLASRDLEPAAAGDRDHPAAAACWCCWWHSGRC